MNEYELRSILVNAGLCIDDALDVVSMAKNKGVAYKPCMIKDRCRYVLPLDQWGEPIYPAHSKPKCIVYIDAIDITSLPYKLKKLARDLA
ncbi:hypothetical protein ABEL47_01685 [Escherichia coli]